MKRILSVTGLLLLALALTVPTMATDTVFYSGAEGIDNGQQRQGQR